MKEQNMPTRVLDPSFHETLQRRLIATFGTTNPDGTIHLTAVWYLFEDGHFFIATSSKTRKAQNVLERTNTSLMVDVRKPGSERGATATGRAELISGDRSKELNHRIHSRYLSPAAIADPLIGPGFAAFDNVTIQFTPESWFTWDMATLDAQAFGGKLGRTPGYLLPLD